ncbi:Usp (universal stress protein) family protein [Sugiyamaella lignohabitans]|uniref:Usp (Universal stress protein) family protein n=1 Tax=Sugiyamaella lignohabitans TaxID=796027 RepID=A0A167FZF1_9ASCO|nr:Usp (universal stress protein) family protein [Sugiyamaella lignohabitans]ANB15901.1 Usp (universal stress protein) family protein [Sugiyamaella lignohabitans]
MSVTFIEPNASKYLGYGLRSSSNSPGLRQSQYKEVVDGDSGSKKDSTRFRRRVSFDTITSDVPATTSGTGSGTNDWSYFWNSSANNSSTALSISPPLNTGFTGSAGANIDGRSVLRSVSPPPYDASIEFGGGLSGLYSTNAVDMIATPVVSNSGTAGGATISNSVSANLRDYMKDKDMSSFVVQTRHKGYKTSISSRTILFSLTTKEYSDQSLRWTLKNLLEDGDELVCLKMYHSSDELESIAADYGKRIMYQKRAEAILDGIVSMVDPDLKINIVVELGIGKVKALALKTLVLYQPSIVVVGTSEKSFSNIARVRYKKTISSYLIARSPVPVIIVSPTRMTTTTSEGTVSSGGSLFRRGYSITPSMSPTDVSCSLLPPASVTTSGTSILTPLSTSSSASSPPVKSSIQPFQFAQKRRRSSTSSEAEDAWPANNIPGSLAYYNYISSAIKANSKNMPKKRSSSSKKFPQKIDVDNVPALPTILSPPIYSQDITSTISTSVQIPSAQSNVQSNPLSDQPSVTRVISPTSATSTPYSMMSPVTPPMEISPTIETSKGVDIEPMVAANVDPNSEVCVLPPTPDLKTQMQPTLPVPSITFADPQPPQEKCSFDDTTRTLLLRRRSTDDTRSTPSAANLRLSPSLSSDAAISSSSSNNSSSINLTTSSMTRNRRASSTTSNLARQTIKWTSKLSPSFLIPKSYRRNS